MGYFVKNRQLQSGSTGILMASGTNTDRIGAPKIGYMRYNVSAGSLEYYNGLGFQTVAAASSVHYGVDNFTGNGSLRQFQMSTNVATASQILVFINGLYQSPGVGIYSVNGTDIITFTTAPAAGAVICVIHTTA